MPRQDPVPDPGAGQPLQLVPPDRPGGTDDPDLLRLVEEVGRVGAWRGRVVPGRSTPEGLVASDTALELLGLDRAAFRRLPRAVGQLIDPDDRQALLSRLAACTTDGVPFRLLCRVTRAGDGALRRLDIRAVAERNDQGWVTHVAGTVADVTELAAGGPADGDPGGNHEQAVIAATPDAIHVFDATSGVLSRANRSGRPLIGFTDESVRVLAGHELDRLVPASDRRRLAEVFEQARTLPEGDVTALQHRVLHHGGEVRWLSRRVTPFTRDADGTVTKLLVVSRDVTDVVAFEQRLQHAALHDDLTGLPNRRLVRDRIERSLRRSADGGHLALMVTDLDGFKRINDSCGHAAGDEVLVEVAARLARSVRPGDTVARLGGDEFAVVLDIPAADDPVAVAEGVAARITAAIGQPVRARDGEHVVTASVGISLARAGATAESLLSDADAAMYHRKSHGADGHAFFHALPPSDGADQDRLGRWIRRALAEDTVTVYYQPIVDRRSHQLRGVEALLRLPGPGGGFLDTARVIAAAERSGVIGQLDDLVLRQVCAQAAAWRREPDLAGLFVSVNRTAGDVAAGGFHGRVAAALADTGLDPRALVVEVAESSLVDAAPDALADLRRLTEAGVGLAIDDFGTGHASLRHLAELPVTCIKIDLAAVRSGPDGQPAALLAAAADLAERLGIGCVVEGVETPEQADGLPVTTGLMAQGWLYAHPAPAAFPLPRRLVPPSAAETERAGPPRRH